MGFRIRLDDGGYMNSARQSIRRAPDSMVEDACMTINSWGSESDGGGCTNSARQSIRGASDSIVENA